VKTSMTLLPARGADGILDERGVATLCQDFILWPRYFADADSTEHHCERPSGSTNRHREVTGKYIKYFVEVSRFH
jgi:hypothetical protein